MGKGNPFVMTSNITPSVLFGPVGGNNLKARAMILNLGGIALFPVIDEILQVHDLGPFVQNDLIIPEDRLE